MRTYHETSFRRANRYVTHSCIYHIAWCTFRRYPLLTEPMRDRMKELIQTICQEASATVFDVEIYPDWVYLNVEIDPLTGISHLLGQIRRVGLGQLKTEFPGLGGKTGCVWTRNYFISTTEEKPEEALRLWLERQPDAWNVPTEQKGDFTA